MDLKAEYYEEEEIRYINTIIIFQSINLYYLY